MVVKAYGQLFKYTWTISRHITLLNESTWCSLLFISFQNEISVNMKKSVIFIVSNIKIMHWAWIESGFKRVEGSLRNVNWSLNMTCLTRNDVIEKKQNSRSTFSGMVVLLSWSPAKNESRNAPKSWPLRLKSEWQSSPKQLKWKKNEFEGYKNGEKCKGLKQFTSRRHC